MATVRPSYRKAHTMENFTSEFNEQVSEAYSGLMEESGYLGYFGSGDQQRVDHFVTQVMEMDVDLEAALAGFFLGTLCDPMMAAMAAETVATWVEDQA